MERFFEADSLPGGAGRGLRGGGEGAGWVRWKNERGEESYGTDVTIPGHQKKKKSMVNFNYSSCLASEHACDGDGGP